MSLDPLFSTLGNLIGALGDVRSATVLREHVVLLKSKFELLSQRIVDLEAENAELIRQKAILDEEFARYRKAERSRGKALHSNIFQLCRVRCADRTNSSRPL